jgi:hypothetical protein
MVTKKDILDALGMETEDRFFTGILIGFGVGALVGGIASLLVAPKSGPELRETIGERVRDTVGKIRGQGVEAPYIPGTTREPSGV